MKIFLGVFIAAHISMQSAAFAAEVSLGDLSPDARFDLTCLEAAAIGSRAFTDPAVQRATESTSSFFLGRLSVRLGAQNWGALMKADAEYTNRKPDWHRAALADCVEKMQGLIRP